jgi:ABC-2 type transport system permease protein
LRLIVIALPFDKLMKEFKGFVIKEFYHIFRDKRTMLVLFGMPFAMMLLFGFVITNEIKDVKIAILDESKDEITRDITSRLVSSGYFKLYSTLNSEHEVEKVFRKGIVKEVVVYEPEFSKKLGREKQATIQIISDASDANFANLITNYTSGIIRTYVNDINLKKPVPYQIIPEIRMVYNPELKGVFMFVPGTIAMILMLICALMTSISIVREKELGTMEVLLVSPLKPLQIIIGKVMPYVVFSFIDALIIFLLGYLVFALPVQGNLLLLFGECLLFILLALSLGILISSTTNSQQIAMMLSMVALLLPTILLSGFVFPIENMPRILQWLCQLMPPKYFIIILKNIMIKGTGFRYVWKETLVLSAMTVFFIIVASKKFKIRME